MAGGAALISTISLSGGVIGAQEGLPGAPDLLPHLQMQIFHVLSSPKALEGVPRDGYVPVTRSWPVGGERT